MKIGKYDPSEFVIPEFDSTGRSVRIGVRVQPLLNQALSDIVASGKFPFETTGDVVRWSLNRSVNELGVMEKCTKVLPFLGVAVLIAQVNIDTNGFQELFAKVDEVVRELLSSDFHQSRAGVVVKAIQDVFLSMPSSRDRSRALNKIQRQWGHLLTGSVQSSDQSKGEHQ
jgi:hypothetical protein